MAITTDPELEGQLTTEATVVLQVRSAAAPVPKLTAALRAAKADIATLSDGAAGIGPKYVSAVIPLPDGPFLMVDLGATPEDEARTIPAIVARHLSGAGVEEAEIRQPDPNAGLLGAVSDFTPMTRALLRAPFDASFRHRPADVPGALLDLALDWLREEHRQGDALTGVAPPVEIPLSWEAAREVMLPVLVEGSLADLVSSDSRTFVAAAAIEFGAVSELAASTAAADGDSAVLTGCLYRQRELVRRAAPAVDWAGVTAEAHFSIFTTHWTDPSPPARGGRRRPSVNVLADVLVPDAMWCQILSPGHLQRLGGVPEGAAEVAPGRFELTIGEPEQWLPGHPDRERVLAHGRSLLAGCLAGADEVTALLRARRR